LAAKLAARTNLAEPNTDPENYSSANDDLTCRYQKAAFHKLESNNRDGNQFKTTTL
jgi:hypothetical protein